MCVLICVQVKIKLTHHLYLQFLTLVIKCFVVSRCGSNHAVYRGASQRLPTALCDPKRVYEVTCSRAESAPVMTSSFGSSCVRLKVHWRTDLLFGLNTCFFPRNFYSKRAQILQTQPGRMCTTFFQADKASAGLWGDEMLMSMRYKIRY